MNNEQILNERWENINKYLLKYLKSYMIVNQKTKDNIQNLFNELDIEYTDINKPIPKSKKNRVNRFIQELKEKGLLKDYFGYKARLIYSKKNITYLEMLEIMLMGIYIEENKRLDEYTNLLFYEVCKDSYEKAIKDIGTKKPISFKNEILYSILNIPIFNMTVEEYLKTLALTNADEVLKKTLNNIQLGKDLDVDNKMYQELFNKLDNRLVNIKEEKISGGIENIVETLANEAYLQAGIDTNTKECRFIAITDKRTTKMCESLNNQIFKLNEMNVYQRYSDGDGRVITYHTKGLVRGENLPPINNHFHWCRSTITYQLGNEVAEEIRNGTSIANEFDKEQFTRYKKYFGDKVPNNVEDFVKMKLNNPEEWENLKARYNEMKKKYNENPNDYVDVTQEWLDNAMPNSHKVKDRQYFEKDGIKYQVDGKNVVLDYSNKEKEVAEWLENTFGGDVYMNPRVNYPKGINTADYYWNDEYWDLKEIQGSTSVIRAVDNSIKDYKEQTSNFIIDATCCKLDNDIIINQVKNTFNKQHKLYREWVNKIIVKRDNELIKVYIKK